MHPGCPHGNKCTETVGEREREWGENHFSRGWITRGGRGNERRKKRERERERKELDNSQRKHEKY